ncbi:YlbL family protein [Terrabacter aerolatus]|uniref:YlbL family protein n=1 Tax=Terrabacter aerolatus TaxID=422442 RepID=UPI001FEBC0DB|nr:PDZ domain-containing protein [Terrabacter aerolatus]
MPEQPADGTLATRADVLEGESRGRLTRGNKAILAAFFFFLVVMVVGSLVHLPYAVMSPGPTQDTLGTSADGKSTPIISISGLPTYPTDGALRFTTVRVEGGPGYPVDVWDILQAWIDPARDVLPVDDVFDPQVTQQQVAEENAIQMEGSQEEATAVALRAIGKQVPTHIAIAGITDTSKAKGVLQVGDRLDRIDGTAITTSEGVRDALQKKKPGDTVSMTVTRKGKELTLDVPTVAGQGGRTALGVLLGLDHDFPAKITIDAGSIGGPSAGLMFSLGIYDKLTPGPLAGGRQIAGTGTIDDQGVVGPIGGIRQKLAGARDDGAQYFLAPADNCNEVVGHVPDGLQVFKVGTFDEGRAAVEAIAKGQTGSLPHC